jgi:hypothetical protein
MTLPVDVSVSAAERCGTLGGPCPAFRGVVRIVHFNDHCGAQSDYAAGDHAS